MKRNSGYRGWPPQLTLKSAITRKNISREQIAEGTGYSKQYVVRLLNGFSWSEEAIQKIKKYVEEQPIPENGV